MFSRALYELLCKMLKHIDSNEKDLRSTYAPIIS